MARPEFAQDPEKIHSTSDVQWNKWPGRAKAAKDLGVSPSKFRELLEEGRVKEYKAPDGSRRYNPEELESLEDELYEENPAKNPEEKVELRLGGVVVDGVRSAIDVTKQAHRHNEELVKTIIELVRMQSEVQAKSTETQKATHEALLKALDFSLKRQEMLEKTHIEAIRAREESRVAELEAEGAQALLVAAETRRTALTDALIPHLGSLAKGLQGSLEERFARKPKSSQEAPVPSPSPPPPSQNSAEQDKAEKAAVTLLRSIAPEQIALLISSGLLDENQQDLLSQVLDKPVTPAEEENAKK